MVTSTAPFPTYEQPCGRTKSVGTSGADATGEADALGEAEGAIGVAVAAEDLAGVPQADTTSMAAISRYEVTLTCTILSQPTRESMTKRYRPLLIPERAESRHAHRAARGAESGDYPHEKRQRHRAEC